MLPLPPTALCAKLPNVACIRVSRSVQLACVSAVPVGIGRRRKLHVLNDFIHVA